MAGQIGKRRQEEVSVIDSGKIEHGYWREGAVGKIPVGKEEGTGVQTLNHKTSP